MFAYKETAKQKPTKKIVSKEKDINNNLNYFGTSGYPAVAQLKLNDYVTEQKILVDQFVYEMYKVAKANPREMSKAKVDELNILSIIYMHRNGMQYLTMLLSAAA